MQAHHKVFPASALADGKVILSMHFFPNEAQQRQILIVCFQTQEAEEVLKQWGYKSDFQGPMSDLLATK